MHDYSNEQKDRKAEGKAIWFSSLVFVCWLGKETDQGGSLGGQGWRRETLLCGNCEEIH